MTGIIRVSKESIFSDLNNLEAVTTTSDMPLSLPCHAVQPVQGGVCEGSSLRLSGKGADRFCFPAGAGQAALRKVVCHGRTGRSTDDNNGDSYDDDCGSDDV